MTTTDHMTTEDMINLELKKLRDLEIPYKYRKVGAKYAAVVQLTNGKKLIINPYRKTIRYCNQNYSYRFLPHWLKKNNLEVSYK